MTGRPFLTLKEAITAYEDRGIGDEDRKVLTLLAENIAVRQAWDGQMRTARRAWDKLMQSGPSSTDKTYPDAITLLSIIIECKSLAPHNVDAPERQAKAQEAFASLRKAVGLLKRHYEAVPELRGTGGLKPRGMVRAHNEGLHACRNALAWMQKDLERSAYASNIAFQETFTTSQKRGDKSAAFDLVLRSNLNFFFNQEFNPLTVAVTSALYPSNGTIDLGARRQAARRERERRAAKGARV